MELKQLKAALEAVLFAYAEPVSAQRLADVLEADLPLVENLLLEMRDTLEKPGCGIQLLQLEGAWQLATKAEFGEIIKKAMDTRRNVPLTPAALEVLAIIAYNQPVSRSFVEQVRGVDSSSTVANLVQKGLVAEVGRLDLPGRPIAFKTTDGFLRAFGISSLSDLPALHSGETQENEPGMMYASGYGEAEYMQMAEEPPFADTEGFEEPAVDAGAAAGTAE